MTTINVVSYQRVSTKKQETERQHKELIEFCQIKKYTIIEEFKEKESGLKDDRSELLRMLEYIKKDPSIEFVIVNEFSRLGRTKDVLNTRDFLHSRKVCLISIKEMLYSLNEDKTVNTTTQMVLGILASVNENEVETIKYRMQSGRINKTSQGYWMGNPKYPYGYKVDEKRLVINDEEAEIVKEIVEMFLSGKGSYTIAKYLNQRGTPTRTKKTWYPAVIYQILTNENLIGKRTYLGVEYECPKILDISTFNKIQERLRDKKNKQGINKKHEYLFDKQKIFCGICGRSYYPTLRKGGKQSVYSCTSNIYPYVKCGNRGLGIAKIENSVTDYILTYFSEVIVNQLQKQNFTTEIKDLENKINEKNLFLKKENSKVNILLDQLLNGNITDELYNSKLLPVKNEIENLNTDIKNLTIKLSDVTEIQTKQSNIRHIENLLKTDKVNSKKYIREIIDKITIYPEQFKKMSNYKKDVCFKLVLQIQRQLFEIYLSHRSVGYEPVFHNYKVLKEVFKEYNYNPILLKE